MRTVLLIPLAALTLAACEATPPSLTTDDILAFEKEIDSASALPVTAINDLPGGTVTYSGEFGSNAFVEGASANDSIIGQMEMTVQFANQNIEGQLYDINLIADGRPQQVMGGTLDIDGRAVNGTIDAVATGTLTRVEANKEDFAFTELYLDGNVQTGLTNADAVFGSVTGGGDGSFDFELDGTGSFYGVAEQ